MEDLLIRCPRCAGRDVAECPVCGGRGLLECTAADQPTGDIWEVLFAAQQAEHGCWFTGGGWGEQPRMALQAIMLVGLTRAKMREKRHG